MILLCLIIIGMTPFTAAFAESEWWQNPAERYLEAYKEYTAAPAVLGDNDIRHFVYFARSRELLDDHPLLYIDGFRGAQIMYSWRELEPDENRYDFTAIIEDLEYLEAHGKKLFIQLQDASFYNRNIPVPDYLLSDQYDGGMTPQQEDSGEAQGWVAMRWNPGVRERFSALLSALGEQFDGRIEGINLQESSISVSIEREASFSPQLYCESLRQNMSALRQAFQKSVTMQYANFMPGEWLPWEDQGYLRSIYAWGEEIGVGLGAPDLMVQRKGQLNHALAMMHENEFSVPLGIAVQDGNYIGETNSDVVRSERENLVPMLHAFAEDFLNIDYMFWVHQEPYFTEDVIPCFR